MLRSRPSLFVSLLGSFLLVVGLPSVAWGGPGGGGTPIVCNVNEDGTQDLAFSGSSSDRVNVIQNGASASQTFPPNGGGVWGLEACEQIGSAGLIAEGTGGAAANFVRVQPVDATGAFTGGPSFVPRGGGAWTLVGTADVDGDGFQDLVFDGVDGTAGEPFGKIEIAVGSNAGSTIFVGLAGGTWTFAGKGDVDADGDEDIVYESDDGNSLRIDLSNGTSVPAKNVRSSSGLELTAIGDVTGDGKADLILNGASSAKIQQVDGATFVDSIFRANGGGSLTPSLLADTNNDGTKDIIFVGASSSRIDEMSPTSLSVGTSAFVSNANFDPVLTGDFDGDGNEDIAGENATGVRFTLLNGSSVKSRPSAIANGGGAFALVD